jgi:hypothetical protein
MSSWSRLFSSYASCAALRAPKKEIFVDPAETIPLAGAASTEFGSALRSSPACSDTASTERDAAVDAVTTGSTDCSCPVATWSVHTDPSQYRRSFLPVGSAYQLAGACPDVALTRFPLDRNHVIPEKENVDHRFTSRMPLRHVPASPHGCPSCGSGHCSKLISP